MASSDLLQKTVADLLEEVASWTPAPGGGAVAAVVVALAAALVEMVARFSGDETAVAQAQALRARVAPLAQADADAYTALLAKDPAARVKVVEVPREVAACAAKVAALASELAERGNPNLRGDALAAALAANAGQAIALKLVEINLGP